MNDLQNNIEIRSMLPVGTILQGGKYRIDRYLSSGGFGNTYVATNTEFEEQVAIKEFFMRGISQRDGDSVTVSVSNETNVSQFVSQKEKFRKEARRLRKLHNNHIVSVHDLFEENGTAYYEMDLIKGESLSERMKRTGTPLSEAEVLAVLDQVLDALAVVHAQGLYHLDLKPANIMMDEKGRALLIDFGASKQMSTGEGYSVSTSSALSFTPGFAPLEQTEQNMKAFGPWTDLYALGATLYKLLTGLTPPSASELLVSREPLVFPTPVSPRMQQLIAWMMKPAYVDRPQSVAEVKCYLEGNSINEETVMDFSQKSLHDQTQSINIPPQQPENKEVIPNEIREFDAKQSITNISEPNGISKNNSKGWIIGFLAIAIFTFIVVTLYNVSNKTQSSPVIISDDATTTEEISQDVIPDDATTTEEIYDTQEAIGDDTNSKMHNFGLHSKHHHHLIGTFEDSSGIYPVELDFNSSGRNVSDVIYKNVNMGGKIRMTCTYFDLSSITVKGKDGNNDFSISLNCTSRNSFRGTAIDGKKECVVVMEAYCQHE